MSKPCKFCMRNAMPPADACVRCLRELEAESSVFSSREFYEVARARAERVGEWLGKVAESDRFRDDLRRRR